ncbi:MmgE/PrpD family protein [Dactylosporangium sp. AC04546]|uniref:MmgE/PrpD family protein n=1 Tax=Dactylosporangium sp. AC04546 TaxID=2862460 RepID=UPI001EE0D3BD|nr:MmgE/PrpD family protein [Dactylosporangium sp. AC04546]WVK78763.1 MmgE/PrpD family protein [Dactylosporangium sp. AC04546]
MDTERALAEFCTGLDPAALPATVRERAELLLVDAIACALTGRLAPPRPDWEAACRAAFGRGCATVVAGPPLAPAGAVHLNAFQITATTMCDVYRPALCHVTPEVVPVVLAVGEEVGASGARMLTALAAGLEVTARLGRSLDYRAFRAAGWHAPGILGPFGAAAAAAVLLDLPAPALARAWGLALGQAGGTFAAIGSLGVKFHQANGALSGYLAARFAAAGIGGTQNAWTHRDGGLFAAYGGGEPDRVTAALGEHWELLNVSMRRWPAASSLQSMVEAVLELRCGDGLGAVERLEVRLPPAGFALCADKGWPDQGTALQSARWVAAVVLADGECWLEQFAPDRLADPAVGAFARTRVTVVADPALPDGAARVTAWPSRAARPATGGGVTAGRDDPACAPSTGRGDDPAGAVSIAGRDDAPGDPSRPLGRDEVLGKLARAAASEGRPERAERLRRLLAADWTAPELCERLS